MKKEQAKVFLEERGVEADGSNLERFWDDKKIFEALLVMGADPNYKPHKDYTILALTAAWNNYSAFSLLLKYGADPNVCCTGNTKIFLINECAQKKRYLKALIKSKVDINKQTCYLETALHHLIRCSNYEIAQLLIDNGADVLTKDIKEKTQLDLAYERKKYHTQQYESIKKSNIADSVIKNYQQELAEIEQLLSNMLAKAGLKHH